MAKRGNIFNSIAVKKPKQTAFDLSFENKLSCNMGKLVPIMNLECLPGDKFKNNSQIFVRFAPMLAPVMHRIDVYTHFFKVPVRLLWNDWKDFITGGEDGDLSPVLPFFTMRGLLVALQEYQPSSNPVKWYRKYVGSGSLLDYLGYPVLTDEQIEVWANGAAEQSIDNSVHFSVFPLVACHLIWSEYYRDQNLSDPFDIDYFSSLSGDISDFVGNFGDSSTFLLDLRNRCWQKDYFTSALPWAQRGPEATIPITEEIGINSSAADPITMFVRGTGAGNESINNQFVGVAPNKFVTYNGNSGSLATVLDPKDVTKDLKVDSSEASVTSINNLRRAFRLQEWLEKNARGGARYIEQIFSHFGVKSSDARLQRPEYIGGGKSPVVISEYQQNALQLDTTTSQNGQQGGKAISAGNNSFSTFCEEHCIIIGFMSVLPRTAYQQGVHPSLTRETKFDYAWPEFAHIGEQEVKNQELYYNPYTFDNKNGETFGYQSRYAEYKYMSDQVHGDFRDSLAFWHMGRVFSSLPALNEDFVTSNPRNDVFAVTDEMEQHLWVDIFNNLTAVRSLPRYGTPSF